MTVQPIIHIVDNDWTFRSAIIRLRGAYGYQVALYGHADPFLSFPTVPKYNIGRLHSVSGLAMIALEQFLHPPVHPGRPNHDRRRSFVAATLAAFSFASFTSAFAQEPPLLPAARLHAFRSST
jgi:hypothetical protein